MVEEAKLAAHRERARPAGSGLVRRQRARGALGREPGVRPLLHVRGRRALPGGRDQHQRPPARPARAACTTARRRRRASSSSRGSACSSSRARSAGSGRGTSSTALRGRSTSSWEPGTARASSSASGARKPGSGVVYPRNEVAERHGASVLETTTVPKEAYARFPESEERPYREGDLPRGETLDGQDSRPEAEGAPDRRQHREEHLLDRVRRLRERELLQVRVRDHSCLKDVPRRAVVVGLALACEGVELVDEVPVAAGPR